MLATLDPMLETYSGHWSEAQTYDYYYSLLYFLTEHLCSRAVSHGEAEAVAALCGSNAGRWHRGAGRGGVGGTGKETTASEQKRSRDQKSN